ncbi:two-component system sensor histidine kinase PmrB [Erwinia sp. 9145]|uniref:two-component system sensor histidine kinase PmrB n=1 Tax=Erwinia sp. 9145 TaxID=1500895 RepID=UPI0005569D5A|nr:two-component system sensor histidine kinase PmrB [Erwinia sp. 9145]
MAGWRQNHTTLRFRLLMAIGLIIFFCQVISVIWLWHESKEQIELLANASLDHQFRQKHIHKEIREAVASLALPSLIMISLTLTLCFQAIKRITRPLFELQTHLENRTEDNLQPIAQVSSVREIDAVTHAINQLVSRISTSLERERLFTADVAHELRTPLAGLRLHLELIEKKNGVNVQPLIQRIDSMTTSVSQLLQLARTGQSFTSGNYQSVSLRQDVVFPLRNELESMLSQREQRMELICHQDAQVRGDATLLKVLLRNLVENAHRYSPRQTTITLRLENASQPMLCVEDRGPGIDESKTGELSKAFVRMDRRYGGVGLGLSIVTRIVQLHDGQFFLENAAPTGCRASVVFPPSSGGKPDA